MGKIYFRGVNSSKHFPCSEDYMFQNQGSKDDPCSLIVKDEEELEFYQGLRLLTGHRLLVTTVLSATNSLLDDVVYFTFPTEELVRSVSKDGWIYRKFKS